MDTALERHTLTVQSSGSASRDASSWARRLATRAGWDEARIYALDLCVVELVANVVDHGYRGGRGEIGLVIEMGPSTAVLTVTDQAAAFDPLSARAPNLPTNLENAALGGFGVEMVRAMAERCRYERRDGRNIFTAYLGAPRHAPG